MASTPLALPLRDQQSRPEECDDRKLCADVNVNPTGTNATVRASDHVIIMRSGNKLNVTNGDRGQISNSYFGLSSIASGINAVSGDERHGYCTQRPHHCREYRTALPVQNGAHVRITR